MGRKLSKNELKRIVQVARMERQKKGVKSVEKKINYNLKWTEAIKIAAKKVIAERKVKQKPLFQNFQKIVNF